MYIMHVCQHCLIALSTKTFLVSVQGQFRLVQSTWQTTPTKCVEQTTSINMKYIEERHGSISNLMTDVSVKCFFTHSGLGRYSKVLILENFIKFLSPVSVSIYEIIQRLKIQMQLSDFAESQFQKPSIRGLRSRTEVFNWKRPNIISTNFVQKDLPSRKENEMKANERKRGMQTKSIQSKWVQIPELFWAV